MRLLKPKVGELAPLGITGQLIELTGWLDQRQQQNGLDAEAVHQVLTRVVDETHRLCDLVQLELIRASPGAPATHGSTSASTGLESAQSQSSDGTSQSQSQRSTHSG